MPKPRKYNTKDKQEIKQFKSPFKDASLIEGEITSFINKFKATVAEHGKRMSDYFEMSCFNLIVKYYMNNGYKLSIGNLKDEKFKYKCSPSGIQKNFSHFKAEKVDLEKTHRFEIHHNLPIQSSHDSTLYATPDISVIKKGKVKYRNDYYDSKKTLSFVKNEHMMTFCEVKHMTPFPELIFNFMGVVNELRKEILDDSAESFSPIHIAPSLMISGKSSKPTNNIKISLEGRYNINILFDLFYFGKSLFTKARVRELRKAGALKLSKKILEELPFAVEEDPF